jgi:hypothetical protein
MGDLLDYLGSAANSAAWADLAATVATGKSAFERVHGMTVWEWLARHPADERAFAEAMVHLTEIDAPAIAEGYPFGELDRICDVAGGRGALLAEILVRHRRPTGVLLDAPQVVERAAAFLSERGVAHRVERVAGSFFDGVPPGCDAYLLKDVLHDWDDGAAASILAACRRAAPPGARVLVAEVLIERLEAASPGAMIDVQMMVACHEGRQRSAAEHHALMARAGFRPGRVLALPGLLGVVEGIAA